MLRWSDHTEKLNAARDRKVHRSLLHMGQTGQSAHDDPLL